MTLLGLLRLYQGHISRKLASVMPQQTMPSRAADYLRHAAPTSAALALRGLLQLPLNDYTERSHILDSGCGPGVVSSLLLTPSNETRAVGLPLHRPARITAIDISPDMIDQYMQQAEIHGWTTTNTLVHDAGDLSCFGDGEFDAVVMNLAIFMVSDAVHCAKEMNRVLKPGGHVVVTTWKRAGVPILVQNVADVIRGRAGADRMGSGPWSTKEKLLDVITAGGFLVDAVDIREETVYWKEKSVADMVRFLSSPEWTDKHQVGWSDAEKAKWGDEIINQMSQEERDTASVAMVGWVCVAQK